MATNRLLANLQTTFFATSPCLLHGDENGTMWLDNAFLYSLFFGAISQYCGNLQMVHVTRPSWLHFSWGGSTSSWTWITTDKNISLFFFGTRKRNFEQRDGFYFYCILLLLLLFLKKIWLHHLRDTIYKGTKSQLQHADWIHSCKTLCLKKLLSLYSLCNWTIVSI